MLKIDVRFRWTSATLHFKELPYIPAAMISGMTGTPLLVREHINLDSLTLVLMISAATIKSGAVLRMWRSADTAIALSDEDLC